MSNARERTKYVVRIENDSSIQVSNYVYYAPFYWEARQGDARWATHFNDAWEFSKKQYAENIAKKYTQAKPEVVTLRTAVAEHEGKHLIKGWDSDYRMAIIFSDKELMEQELWEMAEHERERKYAKQQAACGVQTSLPFPFLEAA